MYLRTLKFTDIFRQMHFISRLQHVTNLLSGLNVHLEANSLRNNFLKYCDSMHTAPKSHALIFYDFFASFKFLFR